MISKSTNIIVKKSGDRGRGVYADENISKGAVIEVCPVVIIPKAELSIIHKTVLHDYYFLWGEDLDQAAIALGYGSVYNHDSDPNADYILDFTNDTIEFVALRDIAKGDEITVDYLGSEDGEEELWFDTTP
jgi:SET domain-containing protein